MLRPKQVKTTDTEAIISVKNIGQTISPENIETIFERFFREDQARNAEQGGAGLGLTIAREIIRAHNGTIKASSQSSFTEFVISLPRRA
jgi:two-component system sensor histidine kinase VanS